MPGAAPVVTAAARRGAGWREVMFSVAERPAHDPPDPYQVLGVGPGASRDDIVHAYRRQARDWHPDNRPHDPDAPARFRALTDAYDTLSDPARRDAYDQRHAPGPPLAAPGTPLGPRTAAPGSFFGAPGTGPVSPAGMPLWAGPVRVEPPAGSGHSEPAGSGQPRPAGTGGLAPLLDLISYLEEGGWPW